MVLRYFDDGKELVSQIQEKLNEIPADLGEDFSKADTFHRMHAAFERDISALGKQVHLNPLLPVWPGVWLRGLQERQH